ncbi:type II secretory pathway, component ExeA [Thiohalobacter thiocyanaticus]|uniref:Type II secretory pathway, component ExeA n=1 Tax=Thiohalobacter thiocyanaticus TaxID=585455 RepID=A0A1Z4VM40_9GAMM|nr:AAA family ATPase [Thiohalobacter thiocyanaticus]BAZ92573.1 type II secretory pathway, component ExeA [Thiohalobacter thiocyanaticus]
MYLEHFGLREAPFNITPDTGFYYESPSHQEALNTLLVALRSGTGFIKVTGEVGTGKTLLCRKLLNSLDESIVTAWLPNPFVNATALRMAFAEELGLEFPRNLGQHRLLKLITDRLLELAAAGKQVVLLIDEAQALPDETLEAIRLLTNLETEKQKLLLVVLFGQPELDARLEQPRIRQLRQRIIFSYRLRPLTAAETRAYVQHRLAAAGRPETGLFTPRALRRLHRAGRGIPRLINILGHKALMSAFGTGAHRVTDRDARRAIRDTEDTAPTGLFSGWHLTLGAAGVAGAGAGAFLLLGTLA